MAEIWGAALVAGAAVVGTVVAADGSRHAANQAADAQSASAQAGIDQQNSQFAAIQKLLQPYANAGNTALTGQQDLIGQNGANAQQSAIDALQNGPQFQSMLKAGNNNILQNASATGGLRGGNTQAALAQFSPQLLNSLIQQQYSNLGGLTSIGQNAAAGVGNAGISTGNSVTSLLQQQGAAQAGNALMQGRATAGLANGVATGIGGFASLGGFGSFGGTSGGYNLYSPVTGYAANPGNNGAGIDPYGYLGGAATAGDFSDVRLKKNIRRIGKTDSGHTLYEWDWRDGSGKGRGVIAQEVAHVPGAVAEDPRSGFLKVDYSRI